MDNNNLVYTIPKLTEVLETSRSKIYQLINSGELKAHKIGRKTLVRHEDVERFVAALEPYVPEKPLAE